MIKLRRPSGKALLVGGVSFIAGMAVAVALAVPIIVYYVRATVDNVTGRTIIDPLLATTQLLRVAEQRPDRLLPIIIANATDESFAAANQFDGLSAANQRTVLRQFQALNQGAIVRAQRGPASDAARLARVMVLCTHHHSRPNWVDFDKDVGGTVGVPGWVLDPDAKPSRPHTWNYGMMRFTDARQLDAIVKHWDALHAWVIQNRDCATANHL